MKKKHKGFKIFAMIGIGIGIVALVTFVVMLLWNWLIPSIFTNGPEITYWQALGILILSKILFGGFKHHHPPFLVAKKEAWKQKIRERWNCMDEDRKAKIRENMFARFHGGENNNEPEPEKEE